MKKSILNTKTFCLEGNDNKEVNFNQETLLFALQLIKIWTKKWLEKKQLLCWRKTSHFYKNIDGDLTNYNNLVKRLNF